jgi:hypothetical protein
MAAAIVQGTQLTVLSAPHPRDRPSRVTATGSAPRARTGTVDTKKVPASEEANPWMKSLPGYES